MKKLIMILAMLVPLCAMSADNFGRGSIFDGATGDKTGADLEDLVTQATLVANDSGTNRIYDNVTIDLSADAPPRLKIKDYGITATKISTGAVTTAAIENRTITSVKIASNTILGINIAANTISTSNFTAEVTNRWSEVYRKAYTNLGYRVARPVDIAGWTYFKYATSAFVTLYFDGFLSARLTNDTNGVTYNSGVITNYLNFTNLPTVNYSLMGLSTNRVTPPTQLSDFNFAWALNVSTNSLFVHHLYAIGTNYFTLFVKNSAGGIATDTFVAVSYTVSGER